MRRLLIGAACVLSSWSNVPAFAATSSAPVDSLAASTVNWNAFHYGRAVDCWTRGDYRAAANYLEQIDVTPASTYSEADHAAFLLASAYLRLNDVAYAHGGRIIVQVTSHRAH